MPAPLVPVAAAIPADQVRVEMTRNPWWTVYGTDDDFMLILPAPDAPATPGRSVGDARSADVALDRDQFAALRCAWKGVTMGDSRPCDGSRDDAKAAIADPLARAIDELRAHAGAAGVGLVGDVRCFGVETPRRNHQPVDDWKPNARMWCEGTARVASAPAGPGDAAGEALDHPVETESTRFALIADASAGALGGDNPYLGTDVGLRYRPFELTFRVIDLVRDRGRVGLGGTLAVRRRFAGSTTDLFASVSETAMGQNMAVNPSFDGIASAMLGIGYQARTKWLGVAQPYISFGAGAIRGDVAGDGTVRVSPAIELRVGMSTPER